MAWYKAGSKMTINGRIVTLTGSSGNSRTAYGGDVASEGQHEWKLKVHKCSNYLMVGVSSTTKYCDASYWLKNDTECYAMHSNGCLYGKTASDVAYANGAGKFTSNDIITVHLDLDKGQIGFSKNNNNLGIAFSNVVKQKQYRLSICACNVNTKFELISYVNLSEEQKNQENETNYIKQCTQLMRKQVNLLNARYSNYKINGFNVNQLNKTSSYLIDLDNDLKQFDIEYKKCQNDILKTQDIIKKTMTINTINYKSWNLKQIELWLYSIKGSDGIPKYKKYIPKLIKNFKNISLSGKDLPQLNRFNLIGWGVDNQQDQDSLVNMLRSLKN